MQEKNHIFLFEIVLSYNSFINRICEQQLQGY